MTEHVNFASDDATPVTAAFDIDDLLGGGAIAELRAEIEILTAHGGEDEHVQMLRDQLALLEADENAVAEAEAIAKARADAVAEAAAEAAAVRGQRRGAETALTGGEGVREGPAPLSERLDPFSFPDTKVRGETSVSLLNTRENLEHLLNGYGIFVGYDVNSKEVILRIPGRRYSADNRMAASLADIKSLCARNGLAVGEVKEYVLSIADSHQRNRPRDWILSKPWDGEDRIQALIDTLDAQDRDLAEVLVTRWMAGAVQCAMVDDDADAGMSMQGVLVLQGPQGLGKTSWFKGLLRGTDRDLWKEGATIVPDKRDTVLPVLRAWICELGELDATMGKSEASSLKSFITLDRDEIYRRYATELSVMPRRTAFCGTVNPKTFLVDETGNRRWWSVSVGPKFSWQNEIDAQQVWAQIWSMVQAGLHHHLTPDEQAMLNRSNEAFLEASEVEVRARAEYDWEAGGRTRPLTHVKFLEEIGMGGKITRKVLADARRVLTELTGREARKLKGSDVWDVPEPLKTREHHLTY